MINHLQTTLEQRSSHIATESFIPTLKVVLHNVHQLFELVFSVGDRPELAAGKACLELIANLIREGVSVDNTRSLRAGIHLFNVVYGGVLKHFAVLHKLSLQRQRHTYLPNMVFMG